MSTPPITPTLSAAARIPPEPFPDLAPGPPPGALAQSRPDAPATTDGAALQQARIEMFWGGPGDRHPASTQSFADWINTRDPIPASERDLARFADKTTMNCYEWALLAAMRAGQVSKPDAAAWRDSVLKGAPIGDIAGKNQRIFGANTPADVSFSMVTKKAGEAARVVDIHGTQTARPGDFITFNGADHVAVVVGRDDSGELVIASHPDIFYGDAVYLEKAKPYVGPLRDFLNLNIQSLHDNDGPNLFKGMTIKVGKPGFQ